MFRKMKSSVKFKLLATVLIITLLPLMLAGYLNYKTSADAVYDMAVQNLTYITELKVRELDQYLGSNKQLEGESLEFVDRIVQEVHQNFYQPVGLSGYGYLLDEHGVALAHLNPDLVGYAWLTAGWGKVTAEAWTGAKAGAAVQGFVQGALEKEGVYGWYASFLEKTVLPNAKVFAFMVAWGEVLVGLGLIVGLLTGIAAFFGGVMNVSFLFAGTLSTNPLLFVLATWLVLAWKVAGYYGLDRWALPYLGTPWHKDVSSPTADSVQQ